MKIDKEETMVPSMILQPYIENAIWHGIMPKEEGGKIKC
jgi:sensor histidine kinase YesM